MSLINNNNLNLYSQGVDKRFKTIEKSVENVQNTQNDLLSNTIIYDPNDSNMRQYDVTMYYDSTASSPNRSIFSSFALSALSTQSTSEIFIYARYVSDIILYPALITSIYLDCFDNSTCEMFGTPNINDTYTEQDIFTITNIGDNILKVDLHDTASYFDRQVYYFNCAFMLLTTPVMYMCNYYDNTTIDGIFFQKRGLYFLDVCERDVHIMTNKMVLSSSVSLPRFSTATTIIKHMEEQ